MMHERSRRRRRPCALGRSRAALLSAALLLLALAPSAPAGAWGVEGHRIVCEIAWQQMTPATRDWALAILARDTRSRRYHRFHEACLWADREGRDAPWEATHPLHYVNLPPRGRFDPRAECRKAGGCAISAIDEHAATLRRPSARVRQRLDALRFLIHFAGDLHQPLHAGYAADRGGTDFSLRARDPRRDAANLHELWDRQLVRELLPPDGRWQDLAHELAAGIDARQRRAWASLDPARWALESHRVLRSRVYAGLREGAAVPAAYRRAQRDYLRERLAQAGFRLARLLDTIHHDAEAAAAKAGRRSRGSPALR